MSDAKLKAKLLELLRGRWPDLAEKAEGGNGWVFVSESQNLAVKVLFRTERYDRFRQEVLNAARLDGITGTVPVTSHNLPEQLEKPSKWERVEDVPFFTMPYFKRGSLQNALSGQCNDGLARLAVETVVAVAGTLEQMHARGIAHRDLKPDNILLGDDGSPCISDYGLSIDLENGAPERLTRSTEIVGAFSYRAPEYLRGRLDASDHRPADIFALGRVLWACVVGSEPFNITDHEFLLPGNFAAIHALKRGQLLAAIIQDAVAFDPLRRPDARTLGEVLREWLSEAPRTDLSGLRDKVQGTPAVVAAREARLRLEALKEGADQAKRAAYRFLESSPIVAEFRAVDSSARAQVYGDGGPFFEAPIPRDTGRLAGSPGFIYEPQDAKGIVPGVYVGVFAFHGADGLRLYVIAAIEFPDKRRKHKVISDSTSQGFDGIVQAQLEKALREGLDWLTSEARPA